MEYTRYNRFELLYIIWMVYIIAKRIVKLIIETRQLFCLCSCRLYFDVYILNAIVLSSKGFDRDVLGIDVNTIFIRFGKIYTQEINSESPTWRYQRYISLDFILYILLFDFILYRRQNIDDMSIDKITVGCQWSTLLFF